MTPDPTSPAEEKAFPLAYEVTPRSETLNLSSRVSKLGRKAGLLWRTVRTIPPAQLAHRVWFEARVRLYRRLPRSLLERWFFTGATPIVAQHVRTASLPLRHLGATNELSEPTEFTFKFIGETRTLPRPIQWNSSSYARLWQFNLHYFNHCRQALEHALEYPETATQAWLELRTLMLDWIEANPIASFDGWHPYTSSLRITNWCHCFTGFWKQLEVDSARDCLLSSLWHQLVFLNRHLEFQAGGNHLAENLRAMIVGGSFFEGTQAASMRDRALGLLIAELNVQILPDGGHYERSPMYHLIMLELVADAAVTLEAAGCEVPSLLKETLRRMSLFADQIAHPDGEIPLFNDAAFGIAQPQGALLAFVGAYLEHEFQTATLSGAVERWKLERLGRTPVKQPRMQQPQRFERTSVSAMPESGYFVLQAASVRAIVDCGIPCPPELPPHAHADMLSFELSFGQERIVTDTGTSQYAAGAARAFERGTRAHSTVLIGHEDQSEIWGAFRVGRRAKPLSPRVWLTQDDHPEWAWFSGGHDGYSRAPINATHWRTLGVCELGVLVLDTVTLESANSLVSRLHLAPDWICATSESVGRFVHRTAASSAQKNLEIHPVLLPDRAEQRLLTGYYAPLFGERQNRLVWELSVPALSGEVVFGYVLSSKRLRVSAERKGNTIRVELVTESNVARVRFTRSDTGWAPE